MSRDEHLSIIPFHIGIVPDGNRRWAKSQGLSALEGHRRGMERSIEIATAAFDRGVKILTMYAFSTENWRRTEEEIGWLMDIFQGFLIKEFAAFEKRNVRFRFAGSRNGLSNKMLEILDQTEARTAHMDSGTVVLCLNYGGQQEIADAVVALIAQGITPDEVTTERLAEEMYAPEVAPVDLIVRTSGEQRLSGFMLWRSDYAELIFVEKHWPDFAVSDLDAVLEEYASRQRRFGK
jgi:undecaprenyl diphosphate synthase